MDDGVCRGGRDPLEDCTVTESFNKRGIFLIYFFCSRNHFSISSWRRFLALFDICTLE